MARTGGGFFSGTIVGILLGLAGGVIFSNQIKNALRGIGSPAAGQYARQLY